VAPAASAAASAVAATGGEPVNAPLAGNVVKVLVKPGQAVAEGESIVVLEAMKMETSVSAPAAGTIVEVRVQAGDSCAVGDVLVTLA
jgi:oxaloacetate decarboxylase alpha subunit